MGHDAAELPTVEAELFVGEFVWGRKGVEGEGGEKLGKVAKLKNGILFAAAGLV